MIGSSKDGTPIGLRNLEARLSQEMDWLTLPQPAWVPARSRNGEPLLDVAIIGGGMSGMAAAAALKKLGVAAVCFDKAPEGFEGPWVTTARMETLRSPKILTGPALGIPSLTFRAWYEAQFGIDDWDKLDKIPRTLWMDYLRWYRRVLDIDIRNEHRVALIRPQADGCVEIDLVTPQGTSVVQARHVVLATGRGGLGGATVPPLAANLSQERWAHSSDPYDYHRLSGKRVGVVGAGASAMDSAATALEMGAARVDLLIRRSDIPRVNKGKGLGNAGAIHGYSELSDELKWRVRHYLNGHSIPPPRASVLRVSRHRNAHFHLACPIESIRETAGSIQVETAKGIFEFDFLIFATGFTIDWAQRPFLSAVAPHVLVWSDVFEPPAGQHNRELSVTPYLGPVFQFREKNPGQCPGIERVYCFCYPAALGHGTVTGDVPAISDGAERLARGLAGILFAEDIDRHFVNLEDYAEPEIFGDEWVSASASVELDA